MSKTLPLIIASALFLAASPHVVDAQPAEPTESADDEPKEEAGDADPDTSTAGKETPPETTEPAAAETPADVDVLRRRYLELRDKLFRSRARAQVVASALYSTRVEIKLHYKSGRHYTVNRATIRLDGANVYDDAEGKVSENKAVRFEGYIAPGRHRITIRIEATGKDDDRFTTATESTFVVIAVEGEDLTITARTEDDGDIAYKWQRKQEGNYRLALDIDVKSKARKGQKKKKKAKKKAVSTNKRGSRRAAR